MKDLNKNAETEKPNEEQNDLKKETAGSSVIIEQPVVEKKIVVRAKRTPEPSNFVKSNLEKVVEFTAKNDDVPKSKEKAGKKEKKNEAEIEVKKSLKKEKNETKPMATMGIAVDLKKEKTASVKVIKKKTKKAEEKVDKLKKKIKKAKKKDVKKSKLKELKGKLEKALDKFKNRIEKLKAKLN